MYSLPFFGVTGGGQTLPITSLYDYLDSLSPDTSILPTLYDYLDTLNPPEVIPTLYEYLDTLTGDTATLPSVFEYLNNFTSIAIAPETISQSIISGTDVHFVYTVTRVNPRNITTTVNYAVSGSSTYPASASDFVGDVFPSGSLVFLPEETTKTVTVTLKAKSQDFLGKNFILSVTAEDSDGGLVIESNPVTGRGEGELVSILNASLWLDAADASTLTVTNNAVSEWRDKTGHNHHASQATGALQPAYNASAVNGKGSLIFTGDSLEVPTLVLTGRGWHVYAVASLSGGAANGRLLSLSGSGGTDWNNNSSWAVLLRRSTTNSIISAQGNIYTTDNAINFNQMYIFGSTYTSTGRSIFTNGVVTGSAANASSALNTTLGARIGRSFNAFDGNPSENWNGTISEIIITPELSNSDRERVEGYLAWKWGLVASLPANHPYKNTAPS